LIDLQRHRVRTLGIVAGLACSGCSALFSVDAGYAHAFAQAPERSAATVNARIGVGTGGRNTGLGAGWSIRTKWSDNVQQVSLAPFLYGLVGTSLQSNDVGVGGFLVGGFDIFTIESVASSFEGSIGSPFIEVGTFVRVTEPWMITLAVSFEDDIRFDATPNTGYVSFLLGFGAVSYTSSGGGFFRH
jgi:hypothetical protein